MSPSPNLYQIPYHGGADIVDPDYRDTVHDEPVGRKSDVEYLKKFIAQHFPRLLSEPTIMETCMYTVVLNLILGYSNLIVFLFRETN